jgi:hypothetical protein
MATVVLALATLGCVLATPAAAVCPNGISFMPASSSFAHTKLPNAYVGKSYLTSWRATGGSPGAGGYIWQDGTSAMQFPPGISESNTTTSIPHDTVVIAGTPTTRWGPITYVGDFNDNAQNCATGYTYDLRVDGPPQAGSFSPTSAAADSEIHITGQDLSPADMTVTFPGGATATATAASTEDDLYVVVPENAESGVIHLSDPGGEDDASGVYGAIAAEPTLSRTQLTWDSVTVGHPETEAVTFTIDPGTALYIGTPEILPGAPFTLASSPCSGQWSDVAQECTVSVTCDPSGPGHNEGTVTVPANTADGTIDIPLICTGVEEAVTPSPTPTPNPQTFPTVEKPPCPDLVFGPTDFILSAGPVGQEFVVSVSGGTAPYTFTEVSSRGSLGIVAFVLRKDGTLAVHSDSAYADGTAFTLHVTDANGCKGYGIVRLLKPGHTTTKGFVDVTPLKPIPVTGAPTVSVPVRCVSGSECQFVLKLFQGDGRDCPEITIGDLGPVTEGPLFNIPVSGGRGPYEFVPKHSDGGPGLDYSLHEDGTVAFHTRDGLPRSTDITVVVIDQDGCRVTRRIHVTTAKAAASRARAKRVVLAAGKLTLAAGKAAKLRLKLTPAARKALKRSRTVAARLRGYVRSGGDVIPIDAAVKLRRAR